MCGITGFSGKFTRADLDLASELISHRGPDGHGTLVLENPLFSIGLAHRRLSILDLTDAGKQPMTLQCDHCSVATHTPDEEKVWLTYNGELYNYEELKSQLISRGHRFFSRTDSEVILHLYCEFGVEALAKLNGIFALAIFDGRKNKVLSPVKRGDILLVRDSLGVKPLYYTQNTRGFFFSSELKGLVPVLDSREIESKSLLHYMTYLYSPAPVTPFKAVKKVLPGEFLIIRNGKEINRKYYYDVPFDGRVLKKPTHEWQSELFDNLKTSVKHQLMSDVPVGAFLSGGIDSTSVVGLMKEVAPDKEFRCFTINHGEETSQKNDLYYARMMAKQFGFPLEEVQVRPTDFEVIKKVIYHLDEPQADPSALNAGMIAEAARRCGIKVMMSGAGGDDVFSGYPRHWAAYNEQFVNLLPESLKRAVAKGVQRYFGGTHGVSFLPVSTFRKMGKYLALLDETQDCRIASLFLYTQQNSIQPLFNQEFIKDNINYDARNPLLNSLARIPNEQHILNRFLYLELKHFLGDHNLNYVDKMAMAHGVEVRVPLIDLNIVKLACQIPPHLKQRGFNNKYILKQAVRKYFPDEVWNRPKQGFGLPVHRWLKGSLKPMVEELLSESSLSKRKIFDPKSITTLKNKYYKGEVDATYAIYSIFSIEMWCRLFLDNER